MVKALYVLAVWVLVGATPVISRGQHIPQGKEVVAISAFFADETTEVFRLSPEGGLVAFLQFDGSMSHLCVADPENLPETKRILTESTEGSVFSFLWLNENGIAFAGRLPGGETRVGFARPLTFDAEDSKTISTLNLEEEIASLAGIVSRKNAVLLSVAAKSDPGIRDIYSVKPDTGERELLHKNEEALAVWSVSPDGTTIVGLRCHSDGRKELVCSKGGETQTVLFCSPEETMDLVAINADASLVFIVTDQGSDKEFSRLEAIHLATGERTVLGEDPEQFVDFGAAVFDRQANQLHGIQYFRDKSTFKWFSPEMEKRFLFLKRQWPDKDFRFRNSSKDGQKWIVSVVSDTEPEAEYFFDFGNRNFRRLDFKAGTIPANQLGCMQAVSYKARDEQIISGYLTIPFQGPESNLPLVVFPHGGPNKRNFWGYDARVQFFASRGYAVFQPNFRGSTGFGKTFQNAGNGQWGRGVMQDDITDGVEWLIENGIADPKRIAIVGGSYGGYAALAGLTFTPNLYAAGVCLFGASNLPEFIRDIPESWKPFLGDIFVKIGNPDLPEDLQRLTWQSPINFTQEIKAPVLVYHGAKDSLIRKSQADRFVSTCRVHGVNVDYLVSAEGEHGFFDSLDEQAVYIAIERFLALHIGGRSQKNVPRNVEDRLSQLRATAAAAVEEASTASCADAPASVAIGAAAADFHDLQDHGFSLYKK
jgi:dienelactone hydrolase